MALRSQTPPAESTAVGAGKVGSSLVSWCTRWRLTPIITISYPCPNEQAGGDSARDETSGLYLPETRRLPGTVTRAFQGCLDVEPRRHADATDATELDVPEQVSVAMAATEVPRNSGHPPRTARDTVRPRSPQSVTRRVLVSTSAGVG